MAVTHVGTSSLVSNVTVPQINITDTTVPLGSYLLIATIIAKSNVDITPPDLTWTEIIKGYNNCTLAADRHAYAIYYKRVTSYSGGQTYSFFKDFDDNLLFAGCISTWSGHRLTGELLDLAGVGVTATVAATENVSFPAIDPLGPITDATTIHMMYVAFYGNDLTNFGTMTPNTNPVCTEKYDLETSSGTDATIAFTSGDNDGTAILARTWASVSTTDAGNTGVVFGVNPEPTPAPPVTVRLGGYTSYDIGRFLDGGPEAETPPEDQSRIGRGDHRYMKPGELVI